jgi:hypothetical protein
MSTCIKKRLVHDLRGHSKPTRTRTCTGNGDVVALGFLEKADFSILGGNRKCKLSCFRL